MYHPTCDGELEKRITAGLPTTVYPINTNMGTNKCNFVVSGAKFVERPTTPRPPPLTPNRNAVSDANNTVQWQKY